DLPIARTVALELLDQLERGLDEALRSGRVAAEADRQAVLLGWTVREAWLHAHAVRATELFPERALQVSTQRRRHRADGHAMHLVVLERPGEHDADQALWLDASSYLLLDDSCWWMHADIPRG